MTRRRPGARYGYTPMGYPEDAPARKMREPENTSSNMRGSQNTSSPRGRWVQPMVAGIIIGVLVATVMLLGIKNSSDWLAPCAHVQQGACYTSTKTIGATNEY